MYRDEIILNYNDAIIRRSDLDIVRGPFFLNDRIIDFYFASLSSSYNDRILLVPSSMSFLLANCPDSDSLCSIVASLNLASKDLILFTVNDNDDFSAAEAGSHWSLLVYRRDINQFIHHDSLLIANSAHAKKLYRAVRGFVGGGKGELIDGFTPMQRNGYDCGVYVMAIAKVVCDWFEKEENSGESNWFKAVDEEVNGAAVEKLRGDVLKLVLHLAK